MNSSHENPKNRLIGFREAVFGSQNGPVLPDYRLIWLIGSKLYMQVHRQFFTKILFITNEEVVLTENQLKVEGYDKSQH